jgi:hypothetical protein
MVENTDIKVLFHYDKMTINLPFTMEGKDDNVVIPLDEEIFKEGGINQVYDKIAKKFEAMQRKEPELNLDYYNYMGLVYPEEALELFKKLKMVACEEPENIKEDENDNVD